MQSSLLAILVVVITPLSTWMPRVNLTLTEKPFPGVCIKTSSACTIQHGPYLVNHASWDRTYNETLLGSVNVTELKWGSYREGLTTDISKFRCSLIMPVCIDVSVASSDPLLKLVPPCRSLCREAADFYGYMRKHFADLRHWPFDCNQFPRPKGVKKLCVPPIF